MVFQTDEYLAEIKLDKKPSDFHLFLHIIPLKEKKKY